MRRWMWVMIAMAAMAALPVGQATAVEVGEDRSDRHLSAYARGDWFDDASGEWTMAEVWKVEGEPTADLILIHGWCDEDAERPGVWLCDNDIEIVTTVAADAASFDPATGSAVLAADLDCGSVDLAWEGTRSGTATPPLRPVPTVEGDRVTLETHSGSSWTSSRAAVSGSACGVAQPSEPGDGWIEFKSEGRRATYVDLGLND